MTMNRIKIILSTLLLLMVVVACENKLDITPKGKTTLSKVSDLELLLNQEYSLDVSPAADLGMVCNESFGLMESVPEILSLSNTLNFANMAYDASVNRAVLTQSDERYAAAYRYINYMNVILDKMPEAEGDDSRKPGLMAEARILRAYFHWLLVNIHAQQYDERTASDKGGIPYVTNTDVTEQKTKLSLEKTYLHILEDCSDEVIELLPVDDFGNVLRADRAFGNAVRAKVLMQMKRYSEALPYALAAIRLNGKIEDRSELMNTYAWVLPQNTPNNYVYMRGSSRVCPTMVTLSCESVQLFEDGDYVVNYDGGWNSMFGMMFAGIPGCQIYFGWSAQGNEYGISSDRMYYTTAECYIRTGDIRKGLEMVDRVRSYRVEDYDSFTSLFDQQSLSEEEAMVLIQKAKWIECVGSYENFFDCKRWNSEDKYKRTITRDLGEYGQYSITPDSPLWVFPFPANATRYNNSLTQNY